MEAHRQARIGALALLLLLTLGGCTDGLVQPGGKPSASASSPSASPTPGSGELTRPGKAREAVQALQKEATGLRVIKVDLGVDTASLSAVKDGHVVAWTWEKGVVSPSESDIQYVQQASFDPSDYHFDDLAGLFATAGRISGSTSDQQLQIVEYNQHQVLMTVTTRPESMPVFFRPDGTLINQLTFPDEASFREALRDTTATSRRVLAIGWSEQVGFWADEQAEEQGVIQRTTRQAKVPAWVASRKAAAATSGYRPGIVDPAVLARLVSTLPETIGRSDAAVSFVIERRARMSSPLVFWDVGGEQVVTTLSGTTIKVQLDG